MAPKISLHFQKCYKTFTSDKVTSHVPLVPVGRTVMTWISSFPCDISIKYTKSVFYFCFGFFSSILWLKIKISSGNPDVCMYVRMYVYICVYVWYVCLNVHTYVCMYVCIHVYLSMCMYVCMYVCTYVRTYVCMYVSMGKTNQRFEAMRRLNASQFIHNVFLLQRMYVHVHDSTISCLQQRAHHTGRVRNQPCSGRP